MRHSYWYSPAYAAVNLAEAVVIFLTFGFYSPNWTFSFSHWYTLRWHTKRIQQQSGKR